MDLKVFYQKELSNINDGLKSDFEHLILETLHIKKLDLLTKPIDLSDTDIYLLRSRIQDLKNKIPLAYILESQHFMGLDFYVDARVLIPRSETEYLVDYCLKNSAKDTKYIFDAGAGSGCIGISYLVFRPQAHCVFLENSEDAIQVLKKNLEHHQLSEDRYKIFKTFEDYENSEEALNKIDLFISNPPYIDHGDERVAESVKRHEPLTALYAEDKGLYYLKTWALKARAYLKDHGQFAIFEFGLGQENELQEYAKMHNIPSEIIKDQYGHNRFWKLF